jgi:hypothetical protein
VYPYSLSLFLKSVKRRVSSGYKVMPFKTALLRPAAVVVALVSRVHFFRSPGIELADTSDSPPNALERKLLWFTSLIQGARFLIYPAVLVVGTCKPGCWSACVSNGGYRLSCCRSLVDTIFCRSISWKCSKIMCSAIYWQFRGGSHALELICGRVLRDMDSNRY